MTNIFAGKKIIVGITGSIAAYKTPLLIRELKKAGAEVKVIMTPSSKEFVSPLVLENLSQNPVWCEMFDKNVQKGGAWHIHTAHECHAMIIAPCSATTIGKLANAICDNGLISIATALPKNIPLLISPAMDFTMLENPATQRNLNLLKDWGVTIIPPDEGELSSGLIGRGRLPEISVLMDYLKISIEEKIRNKSFVRIVKDNLKEIQSINTNRNSIEDQIKFQAELELQLLKNNLKNQNFNQFLNKKVLITAGPTIEKIDEVRYISNFSSGKMGYALAETCKKAGMDVTLISGKVSLPQIDGIKTIFVESAEEMFLNTKNYMDYDLAILTAAVADYKPKTKIKGKLKKDLNSNIELNLTLEKNPDILNYLGLNKKSGQLLVGFALEYDNELENAKNKLKQKNCDLLVLNSANKPDSGFEGDYNTITIIDNQGKVDILPTMSKSDCSINILLAVKKYMEN